MMASRENDLLVHLCTELLKSKEQRQSQRFAGFEYSNVTRFFKHAVTS